MISLAPKCNHNSDFKLTRVEKSTSLSTVSDLPMAAIPGNQNGTLQALTNALNIFTNTIKQAAASPGSSTTPQLLPAITSFPASAITGTISSPVNQVQASPASQQSSTVPSASKK